MRTNLEKWYKNNPFKAAFYLAVFGIIGTWYITKIDFQDNNNSINTIQLDSTIEVPIFNDSSPEFNILILPFIQYGGTKGYNKQVAIKIIERLTSLNIEDNLNILIRYYDKDLGFPINEKDIETIMNYHSPDMILYGSVEVRDETTDFDDMLNLRFKTNDKWKKYFSTDWNIINNNNALIYQNAGFEKLNNGELQGNIEYVIYSVAAREQFYKSHFRQCLKYCNVILKNLKINSTKILSLSGDCYLYENIFDTAKIYYNLAINLKDTSLATLNNRSVCYTALNLLDSATYDNDKVIHTTYNQALAFNNRGLINVLKGNFSQSLQDYHTSISLDPNQFLSNFSLGEIYLYFFNNYDTAAYFLYKSKFLKDIPEVKFHIAYLQYETDSLKLAYENFKSVISADSTYLDAYIHISDILNQIEKPEESLLYSDRGLTLFSPEMGSKYFTFYLLKGESYNRIGQCNEALVCFNKYLSSAKEIDSVVYIAIARSYSYLDNYLKGIIYSNIGIKYSPDNKYVYLCRGYCYGKLGKYEEACKDFQIAYIKGNREDDLLFYSEKWCK